MAQAEQSVTGMQRGSLGEVASYFVRLGLLAFGGAAGHVAMMRRELVERRGWISQQDFLDLFGMMNLIPGPSSTELVIALGYSRAGWPALILAGGLFILPAMLMVMALAWAYVTYGALPAAQWILYGINPIVIAIVADALWSLGRAALKSVWLAVLCVAAIALYFRGFSVIAILFGAIALTAIAGFAAQWRSGGGEGRAVILPLLGWASAAAGGAAAVIPFTLTRLFFTFLKIGAVAYGSGYVLLAFLRADFVAHLHWLTDKQLLDSVAVGQLTPGPVFTSATFVGYLMGGVKGALLATLGMFLPSFLYVAILFPLIPRLRGSAAARLFLDGVNATTVGLMGAVSWQVARGAIVDWFTAAEAIFALVILRRVPINSAWLILGGTATGFAFRFLTR
ncbi:MAG TPA: chromate efflux transporter [Candidatus Sulfotelmatobacter sp.]|nr:chromate efflux transporter [Candidatus Sulfotelmatobacter sp.]